MRIPHYDPVLARGPMTVSVTPVGDEFVAAIDVDPQDSDAPSLLDEWGFITHHLALRRRTFAKAARAIAEEVAKQTEGRVYRSLIAAQSEAGKIEVQL